MSCLNDNLDQVRALTDALVTANDGSVSHAVTAALNLTPIRRCADVALLKSAVPLPKDEQTLREVLRLRRQIAEVEAMREVGKISQAMSKAIALRPQVESAGYRPLLGELLETTGLVQSDAYSRDATKTLEEAFFAAESAGDDPTAARAATTLSSNFASTFGQFEESERWYRLANSILDRLGTREARTRAWALNNWAEVLIVTGHVEDGKRLLERAVVLKEESVGPDHPDVAISLDGLSLALVELGRPSEAIQPVERAIAIYLRHSDPGNPLLGSALSNKGDALRGLGRNSEARLSFERSLEVLHNAGDSGPFTAGALCGLGETDLAEGQPAAAVPLLERSVEIYGNYKGMGTLTTNAQFALARALWDGGGDRIRARTLAKSALEGYRAAGRTDRQRAVDAWLTDRGRRN
jgi:serine/threonine-protein kinase